ncbi:MAG: hypothetical protein HYV13_03895 [Candidatus Doudnabacteria bacterium]|nr:hypothetical protein [Candidatus Doudnabacteria bacterium]
MARPRTNCSSEADVMRLVNYVLNHDGPDEHRETQKHLKVCGECREMLTLMRKAKRRMTNPNPGISMALRASKAEKARKAFRIVHNETR